MIRLRKHDRKMLKVSAALASVILVLLGLIWVDMQRGFRSLAVPPGTRNNVLRSSQQSYDRNDARDNDILSAANIRTRDSDPLFDSSGRGLASSVAGDFSDHSSAFESSGSESSSSIPEPSTLAIAAIGGGVLLLNRRRAVRFLMK